MFLFQRFHIILCMSPFSLERYVRDPQSDLAFRSVIVRSRWTYKWKSTHTSTLRHRNNDSMKADDVGSDSIHHTLSLCSDADPSTMCVTCASYLHPWKLLRPNAVITFASSSIGAYTIQCNTIQYDTNLYSAQGGVRIGGTAWQ